jgi:hypothetical protein
MQVIASTIILFFESCTTGGNCDDFQISLNFFFLLFDSISITDAKLSQLILCAVKLCQVDQGFQVLQLS